MKKFNSRITSRLWRLVNWLNAIPCKCGCRETVDVVTDMMPVLDNGTGPVMEYAVRCTNCGDDVNYWAYGNFEYPTTWAEYVEWRWHGLWFRWQSWKMKKACQKLRIK